MLAVSPAAQASIEIPFLLHRCPYGLFSLYQSRDGVDGAKILDIQIFVGDGNAQFFFDEEDQLHGEERIHEAQGEKILVILQLEISEILSKKGFDLCTLVHAKKSPYV
jgi:hypothetical protein